MTVTHAHVSAIPDDPSKDVSSDEWNAAHSGEIDDTMHGSRGAALHADSHAQLHAASHADAGSDEIVDATQSPSTQAFGDSAAAGADTTKASPVLHKHAMPADPVTAHVAASDPHTGYVLESLLDAKGDLYAASADNTPGRLAVGANGTVLTADSVQALGVKWQAPAAATVAIKITEQDFGSTPTNYAQFTVSDVDVLAASHILVSLSAEAPAALRDGLAADGDEADMEPMILYAQSIASGSFLLTAEIQQGPVTGPYKFQYLIG